MGGGGGARASGRNRDAPVSVAELMIVRAEEGSSLLLKDTKARYAKDAKSNVNAWPRGINATHRPHTHTRTHTHTKSAQS